MDINFNNIQTNRAMAAQAAQNVVKADEAKVSDLSSYDLTISLAEAAVEDIRAADIPKDALRRDDDLGKLVSAAFTLPAPPFPEVS